MECVLKVCGLEPDLVLVFVLMLSLAVDMDSIVGELDADGDLVVVDAAVDAGVLPSQNCCSSSFSLISLSERLLKSI